MKKISNCIIYVGAFSQLIDMVVAAPALAELRLVYHKETNIIMYEINNLFKLLISLPLWATFGKIFMILYQWFPY